MAQYPALAISDARLVAAWLPQHDHVVREHLEQQAIQEEIVRARFDADPAVQSLRRRLLERRRTHEAGRS